MAYISAEDVKAIREELKAEFPKFKFGVRKGSGSLSVDVTIKQASFAFKDQFEKQGREYAQVNQYWIKDHFSNAEEREFILKVNEIMHNAPGRRDPSRAYFDESDAMTDYFHTAFYTHLQIGSWNQPYVQSK